VQRVFDKEVLLKYLTFAKWSWGKIELLLSRFLFLLQFHKKNCRKSPKELVGKLKFARKQRSGAGKKGIRKIAMRGAIFHGADYRVSNFLRGNFS